ncbi:MAG: type II/IV secretion system protein [Candidatus Wallbacteria bacterium]|nr:type II/IV secretion system protein [Candidatus Wallbacteria bacterium]
MPNELNILLRDSGLVPAAAFEELEREQTATGGSLLVALSSRQPESAEQFAMLAAQHYALPFAHLPPGKIDTESLPLLTLQEWRRILALPVERKGDAVRVGTADPALLGDTVRVLQERGSNLELMVAPLGEIEAELARSEAPAPCVEVTRATELPLGLDERLSQLIVGDSAPAAVDLVVGLALTIGASDIHLIHDGDALVTRLRKDGSLLTLRPRCPEPEANRVLARLKVLAGLDIVDKRHPQDGRSRIEIGTEPPVSVLLRVATFPCIQGEKVAVRILETGNALMDLHQIGFTRPHLTKVRESLRFPNGLFLVTGPTGSGKTTSLYAALRHLANPSIAVFTIEDPVEFEFPGAYQSQVNEGAGVTYPQLLRALLRQDPNVILLGEVRDSESAQTALQAAMTGRLVLTTLHANSACTALTRLMDMGVEPFVLGTCTRAIVAQRLVRLLCSCKRPVYRMSARHVRIKERLGLSGSSIFEPVGCPRCYFTGFQGRIAVHEVLTLDRGLSDMVIRRSSSSEILDAARAQGFRVMAQDGFSKVFSGLTTVLEVERQVGPAPGLEA